MSAAERLKPATTEQLQDFNATVDALPLELATSVDDLNRVVESEQRMQERQEALAEKWREDHADDPKLAAVGPPPPAPLDYASVRHSGQFELDGVGFAVTQTETTNMYPSALTNNRKSWHREVIVTPAPLLVARAGIQPIFRNVTTQMGLGVEDLHGSRHVDLRSAGLGLEVPEPKQAEAVITGLEMAGDGQAYIKSLDDMLAETEADARMPEMHAPPLRSLHVERLMPLLAQLGPDHRIEPGPNQGQ